MKNFEEYENKKRDLLRAYESVLASDILPIDETGPAQVRESRHDLETGRFFLAVCGRIKAGKSTLLNALLFQDWVMPTDDLPHTAKNTLVEYGEQQALEVTFFNREEWQALIQELRASEAQMAQDFFAEIDDAADRDIVERDWILAESRVEKFDSVADLAQFVTPVEKGGIYTPFVKQVKLVYPHPWLRSVTIADTPGVDDPYKFREDQTKKFVTRAGAVLFVTYAGQAMSQPDFDFMNDYLIHVPQDRRLIAVNKIDTLKNGNADVDSYLKGLMEHAEPSIRNVFGKRDSIKMVSALGGLIADTEQAGREVPEEYIFYRDKMVLSGHLKADKNGVDALRLKVEERLVKLNGTDIIKGHVKFLSSLFERKRRIAKAELSLSRGRLDDLDQTQGQLAGQIEEIEGQLLTMAQKVVQEKKLADRAIAKHFQELAKAFGKASSNTLGSTRLELEAESRIETIAQRAAWIFLNNFDQEKDALGTALDSCAGSMEVLIQNFSDTLRASWARWEDAPYLDDVLSYSTYETLFSLRKLSDAIASPEQLEKLREQSTMFFQRWFNTQAGRAQAREAILASMRKQLEEGLEQKYAEVMKLLQDEIKLQMTRIGELIKAVQQGRLDDKEKLSRGHHDRGVERAKVLGDIETIERRLQELAKLEETVNSVIGMQV